MFDKIEMDTTERFARCIEASKRVRWEIERDVIQGRAFDTAHKYLPDGLSLAAEFTSLSSDEKKYLSQIQGRTYANIFGLVERFINAKILELSRDYWLGDQVKLEALVRFSDEELKHQELFRRIETMIAEAMPAGYTNTPDPDAVAQAVLSKCTWAVLTLTLHIELFTQQHYRESIDKDEALSPLFKDVFLFHWKEESQHAILDELELRKHDATLTDAERDQAVTDFIELVGAVDGILQAQAAADAGYFANTCGRDVAAGEVQQIEASILKAYRWQYILSGAGHPQFQKVLGDLLTDAQLGRIVAALGPLQA
ncbi:hypothetical protein [Kordiimonas lacus]|uniref:p-aminobenzoate N-oxygenase AurF n=1 Tax=Kordiimonas lacus TaxID=637679 RepID=A0A1G6YLP6_9PROT|nr:hypothetical protein [Kordiimonas lacus]SDD91434.1 hypothetical protein SAMN04488071_1674 [Kordiimonas lacus]